MNIRAHVNIFLNSYYILGVSFLVSPSPFPLSLIDGRTWPQSSGLLEFVGLFAVLELSVLF